MKAIHYTAFGGSDVIQLVDAEKPELKDDEVLIKAVAIIVNPTSVKL